MGGTAGWIGARRRHFSGVVGVMVALAFVAVALGRPAAAQAVGELSYDACFGESSGCTFVAGGPLEGADSVAVSPNGGSVYVTGQTPNRGSVAHFFVGDQGRLGYDGCVSNDGSAARCADVAALIGASGVAVSPNSGSVYTANAGPMAAPGDLVHFFADRTQGQLTYDGCVSDDGSGGTCGSAGSAQPLLTPTDVAVSPNGASVYAVSDSGTLSQLFANPSQGQLTYGGCISNDGSAGACGVAGNGMGTALHGAFRVAVSPNGASVYTANESGTNNGGTLAHLFANPIQGQLTWDGCVSDDGSGSACLDVPGTGTPLATPTDVAVSPDGASVYAVSFSGTVSHLFANPQGQLSWDGCVSNDGSGGTCADVPGTGAPLDGAFGVAVSPDGRSLYVASRTASSISSFSIAPGGQLTFQGCLSDNAIPGCVDPPGEPLKGADAVAVSPDGRSVYVTGSGNGTVAHFFRAQSSGGGTGGGGGGGGGGTSNPTRTITAKIDNQQITVVTSLRSGCVAKSGSLSATLSSSTIPGSKATKLRSTGAALSIDRGVRHVHHRTAHNQGKKVVITTITYSPNQTVRTLPTNVSLKLAGLSSRSHLFNVKVFYRATVKRHGQRHTVTVTKTLSLTFQVC